MQNCLGTSHSIEIWNIKEYYCLYVVHWFLGLTRQRFDKNEGSFCWTLAKPRGPWPTGASPIFWNSVMGQVPATASLLKAMESWGLKERKRKGPTKCVNLKNKGLSTSTWTNQLLQNAPLSKHLVPEPVIFRTVASVSQRTIKKIVCRALQSRSGDKLMKAVPWRGGFCRKKWGGDDHSECCAVIPIESGKRWTSKPISSGTTLFWCPFDVAPKTKRNIRDHAFYPERSCSRCPHHCSSSCKHLQHRTNCFQLHDRHWKSPLAFRHLLAFNSSRFTDLKSSDSLDWIGKSNEKEKH